MMDKLIGFELELMLTDADGNINNRADDVLHHQLNPGTLVKEGTYGVVEVHSLPKSSLLELESLFKKELMRLAYIVESFQLKAIPLSEVGPHGSLKKRGGPRYAFQLLVGADKDSLYDSACGTHIHFDHEQDLVGQYNLLQSLDPVFVLLSTSSFLRGTNTLNCSRVNAYRNHVFEDFPLHGQLLDYVSSIEQLERQNEQRLTYWQRLIGPSEETQKVFDRYNTCWGPIRLREKTIEVRNADANIFSLVMAMVALYKGVKNYVFSKGLDVKVGGQEQAYGVTDSEIILPPYPILKQMEIEGIIDGLGSEVVHRYLSYLVDIAEDGLPASEKRYLQPFKQILNSRKNVADVIISHVHRIDPTANGTIGGETAKKVNRFIADLYLNDLSGGQQAIELIQNG